MTKNYIKNIIDNELNQVKLKDAIKNRIIKASTVHKAKHAWKSVAASIIIAIIGGTTAYAGYQILNKIHVNEDVLTALDNMQLVQINNLDAIPDEYGIARKEYDSYIALQKELGIKLLDTELSYSNPHIDNPYMLCHIMTDNKDFAIITIDNFIIGDTYNYQFIEAENRYSYTHGTEYFTPISLTADLILSEAQMINGWERDYLGLYEFVESYISDQGYTVNIIQDTTIEQNLENYISEKIAIFVADGIRYSVKGRVSIDTLKSIVNTMK